ncbi:hypothetical protein OSB04_015624 [Centaurea solstitialis]|uniref:TIR domain-containing protein n=1 Tax=Centaurea solstitialis TaxID=347529 RepID=A0AA38SZD9_9ASTR|nr:hypothetical protein OSB04_015624 [Centaurea solstitialis]
MASSSSTSSASKRSFKYDVFLSFRGEDTRKTFVDHLYYALQQKGIHTYKDDERIEKGKKISDELIKSIEDSRFYIVVFSKNYASSSWCLGELVKIVECQKTTEQTAFPVFYDVEPSEVRKQIGEFGKVFAKHENEEDAGKWREALKEAANLVGWDLQNTDNGHEAKFIQRVVQEISRQLLRSINFSNNDKLIGMKTRVMDVVTSLGMGSSDVRMIGIMGIGGGGKTTLARAVFDEISSEFEGNSFVENVREASKTSLSSLQKRILKDVLDYQDTVSSVSDGKDMMNKMMRRKKVLVVLDDVDHIVQLEALAGATNWFQPGSRIIITTRDKQVLVAHRVNLEMIHNVNLLSNEEAICLFSRYAFGKEIPIQGYEELSQQVVGYAKGLPLTIRVLGSFLCGNDDQLEWKDTLEKLKTNPLKETLDILEISFNGLEEHYKEIFLDVACILKGWRKDEAIRVLESCGLHARIGLRVLEQRSLITISVHGFLGMHDHIEEMGRNIVRRSHPDEPNKHSRLWIDKEIQDALAHDLGKNEATKCIKLQMKGLNPEYVLKGLGYLKKLIFLHVSSPSFQSDWKFDEFGQYLPNSLRYMSWEHYPFLSFPKTFQANNLVTLQMHRSRIVQLWEVGERKDLEKLRYLDLNSSMLKTLDLGRSSNLEKVILARCCNLYALQMPLVECQRLTTLNLSYSKLRTLDLRQTPNLQSLNLGNCNKLVQLHVPDGGLKSLETLWLSDCFGFTKFSFKKKSRSLDLGYRKVGCFGSLSDLHLSAEFLTCPLHSSDNLPKFQFTCFFEELGSSLIGNLENSSIGLRACTSPMSLSQRICGLQCVTKLTLSGSIQEVPKDLGRLGCLEKVKLSFKKIKHLPDSICKLKHLKTLRLEDCHLLEKLPEDLVGLERLEVLCLLRCINLRDIPNNILKMKHLKCFDLNGCIHIEKLPEELGCITCLRELYIEGTGIAHLPLSIMLLEGLHIKGSTLLHQSCTSTFDREDLVYNTFYHRGTRSRSLLHDPDF